MSPLSPFLKGDLEGLCFLYPSAESPDRYGMPHEAIQSIWKPNRQGPGGEVMTICVSFLLADCRKLIAGSFLGYFAVVSAK